VNGIQTIDFGLFMNKDLFASRENKNYLKTVHFLDENKKWFALFLIFEIKLTLYFL